jgi:hypothetical protein
MNTGKMAAGALRTSAPVKEMPGKTGRKAIGIRVIPLI